MSGTVDQVAERVGAAVPELAGRIEQAAQLAELMRQKALPQKMPACFVMPPALSGGRPDTMTGIFRQPVEETVAIVLFDRVSGSVRKTAAAGRIDTMAQAVIEAVAGWASGDEVGAFRLVSARLTDIHDGTIVYQLQFGRDAQLRIAT